MKVDEVVSKAELFAMNFIAKISDASEQPARKQVYFLDNQEELQQYMGALQKIVTNIRKDDSSEDGEDYEVLLNRADAVIDKLKKQCIIVTKDFITKGQLRLNEIDKLTCGVYRIRKADNFDSKNMATIRTLVEKVK